MAVEVKHSTTVVVPDDGTSPVGSDEWNAVHQLTQDGQRMLGKPSAGAGPTQEMDGAAVLAFAGAEVAGAAAAAVAAHVAAADPHPGYLTPAEGNAAYAAAGHVGAGGTAHANVVAGGAAGFMSGADKTKLDGIAAGATANSSDATLLARASHTGTQAASTINDFNATSRAQTEAALIAGTNITITPAGSGASRTLTIAAAGGGAGTNLAYDAATRVLSSDTGSDATLPLVSSADAGLAPASGGGTSNFLRADGTWAAPGGGGAPGGASGEVQYNASGAFAGAANVEIESGNLRLAATTDPAAPAAGGLLLYARLIAGRILPKIVGPAGIDTILQVGLSGNSVFMVAPASGTSAPTAWGGTLTTAATMSLQQTIASANPWLATSRKRFQTSATAGNATGMRTAYRQWFRANAAGFGGFFFRAQLGMNINLNGGQKFVGLCASTGALDGEPSALVNMIGMGYDSTDASTGNWFLMRNDGAGTATKVDLGTDAARNTTHGYDLIIFCPPGAATEIFVRIINIQTAAVVLDTSYTTDLPAVNTGLAFKAEVRNGAVAAADNLEVAKVYIESDY